TQALPTSYYDNQQLNYRRITENYVVDIHAFSSVFSTHLLFDHLDGTFSSLSKNISLHFQDLVQVSAQSFGINDDFVVDVELLKGQLQGAVGSFIEDSLPNIWNARASVIDKANLSIYIEQMTVEYCPTNHSTILNNCIEDNAQHIVSKVDYYIRDHLLQIISIIVKEDLPPLFQTTQSHVNSILAHFSKYLQKKASMDTFAKTIVMYHSFENAEELTVYLQSTIGLYHPSLEKSTLEKYISLARVD
ncbi:hypothetical protein INT48_006712, partial [Thamnidium elegans]